MNAETPRPPILEIRDLVKHYGEVRAVNGITLAIPEGVCFGLLGPNGAGKSTTIEMIEGIKTPTAGEIVYRGKVIGGPRRDAHGYREFRERCGIQFQETALQDYLTVREVLHLFARFYRHPASIDELVRLCALEEFLDRDTDKLSGGQRQRVLLAIALVNDPDVVFLDEPTTGLDPQARRNFWDLIRMIKARGKTIVLTTHYMEEADLLCDEVAIVDRGQVIARGKPADLLRQHFNWVTLTLPGADFDQGQWKGPSRRDAATGDAIIETNEVSRTLTELIEAKVPLAHLRIREQSLEDLFLKLTGREIRD